MELAADIEGSFIENSASTRGEISLEEPLEGRLDSNSYQRYPRLRNNGTYIARALIGRALVLTTH
jgi:hypothetical protein